MRQPYARRTGRAALDQCYVYCQNTGVGEAVQFVKAGLEQEGMTGLDDEVRSGQSVNIKTVTVRRRERFREAVIFLPQVLHRDGDGGWMRLDYQRHILPGLDLEGGHRSRPGRRRKPTGRAAKRRRLMYRMMICRRCTTTRRICTLTRPLKWPGTRGGFRM